MRQNIRIVSNYKVVREEGKNIKSKIQQSAKVHEGMCTSTIVTYCVDLLLEWYN